MPKAISDDLRLRACQALSEGQSGREVARRFAISAASISRWRARYRKTGQVSAASPGGDFRSQRIENHAELILARMRAQSDTTLEEYQALLLEAGQRFAISTIWRFFDRRGITHKKRLRMPPNKSDLTSRPKDKAG
jgi:transposase